MGSDEIENDPLYRLSQLEIECEHGAPLSQLSLLDYDQEQLVDDAHEMALKDGYGAIVDLLTQQIQRMGANIEYGKIVQTIEYEPLPSSSSPSSSSSSSSKSAVPVRVITGEGCVYFSHRCIISVPISVLQAIPPAVGSLTFNPPLPIKLRSAIGAIQMATMNKVLMRFEAQFWPDFKSRKLKGHVKQIEEAEGDEEEENGGANLSGRVHCFSSLEFPDLYLLNFAAIFGHPVLQCCVVGGRAVRYESMTDQQILDELSNLLVSWFLRNHSNDTIALSEFTTKPSSLSVSDIDATYSNLGCGSSSNSSCVSLPRLVSYHITRWHSDPFSRGSYSFLPVGSSRSACDVLASSSVANRIWLTGEANHRFYSGTVHGGWLAGEATARTILSLE